MNSTFRLFYAIIVLSFITSSQLISQNKKSKVDYLDPTENFYVTQARMNKYFKKFERELERERREKSAKVSHGKASPTGVILGDADEHEVGSYELYKRWENFMEPRVYPSGDKTLASKAYEEYMKFVEETAQQNSANKTSGPASIMSSTWQPIGPFGDLSGANAGRINSIRFDPTSSTGYWASAPAGGLFSTTNNGSSWTTNTDYLSAIGCSDVVFDPTNAQNMWMASGDGDAGDCSSIGVLKSTNGGLTWSATGLAWTVSQGRRIYKLLINPLNKNTIFAATTNGLYKTVNGGTSWSQIIVANIRDVEYRPNDTTVVYAASTSFYKSTNGGATFSTITAGLPTSAANDRLAIAVTPANNSYVYVVASNASNDGFLGFYQSTNSGTSFTTKATTPNLLGWASAGNDVGGQGWYDLAIDASPTNANEVLVGGVNIWKTTNAGTNWSLFAHWTGSGAPYVHADIHDIKYKSATSIYIGCDGGAFYTTNSGGVFFSMNGNMNIAQIYKIGNSATTYSKAITGHQDNGTNLFNGGSWAGTMGGDGMDCFIDRTNDNVMYGEQYNGAFKRTTNGGANWSNIVGGLSGTAPWVTSWHQDPAVANTLYAGRQQMFKTTNQGTSWAQIGTIAGTSTIKEFAVAPSNNQVIYVIKGSTLYKTTNGGGAWTNVTGTLPVGSAAMTSVVIKDTDPNVAFVSFSGYSTGNKVYKTTNGGTTWTNYSTGLPNLPANRILYWNGSNEGVYLGMDVGVYYRDASLANWVPYNTGLPNVQISDLAIFYPLGKIRAASYGRSVWEADLYNTGNLAPIANFTSDKQYICPSMTVNYTDLSSFAPTTWNWVFQGGSPATSTLQNPSVSYASIGTYSVSLTASNTNGTSVMTKTLYITVTGTNTIPMVEGFQSVTFPPTNWQNYDDGADTKQWARSATVGKASTASMWFDNYTQDASNTFDEMRSPKYSFVGWTNVKMFFDVAYARYDPNYTDTLSILVSSDCGITWNELYLKGGTALSTAPDFTASTFVPTAAQWRTDTVYLSAYSGMNNVMVSFRNKGHYGQALYIDNINIAGSVASLPPTASFSYAAAAPCTGQSINFTDQSSNSPTSWSWSFPGGTPATSTAQNPVVSYSTAGPHVATLTSSNSIGASSPVSQTITVIATPTVAASSASATICNGQTVMLSGTGATTYSWSSGAGTSTTNVSPTSNTTYTVTGTTSGCSSTAVVSVVVNPTPTVTVNSSTVCAGASANLNASGATTYSWNTGATSSGILASPSSTTVYTVTGTTSGCSSAKTSTVTVTPIPTVAVNDATVCLGSSANITASGATTYSWSTGATSSGISVSPTVTTVYTVTGTTSGCTNSKTSTVTVNALPTVTANNTGPVCVGSPVTLTCTAATSYTWSGPAGFNSNSQNPNIASPTTANAGTYSITITGANGCKNTTTTALVVNTLPTVTSNTAAICSGAGNVTLTATGATTYSWNTGATTAAIVVSPVTTTNYTVTGTNGLGCKNSYTTTVFVSTSPTVAVSNASVCSGNATTLSASGALTYSWSTGATTSTIAVSPLSTTVYTITGNNSGCTDVKTATVIVNATPTVVATNQSICNPNSATLTASGATTYSWNTGATTSAIVVTPASTTVYTVTGTTGSCTGIRTVTVTVNTTPTVSVNSATICAGSSTTLNATGAATYSWNTGATSSNIVVNPTSNTTYTVTGSNSPCSNLQTALVAVNALPSVSLSASSSTACTNATGGVTLTLNGSPSGGVYSGTGVTGNQFNPQATAGVYTPMYTYTSSTNGCVNSSSVSITVNVCTGIGTVNVAENGEIQIMPNPNNGLFTIKSSIMEKYEVIIYNSLGQLINKFTPDKKEVNVDLSLYGSGVYNVVFKIGDNYKTIKVIVE